MRTQMIRVAFGVLTALTARGRVRHFELARPSLHDIFVRIAGLGTGGPSDA